MFNGLGNVIYKGRVTTSGDVTIEGIVNQGTIVTSTRKWPSESDDPKVKLKERLAKKLGTETNSPLFEEIVGDRKIEQIDEYALCHGIIYDNVKTVKNLAPIIDKEV